MKIMFTVASYYPSIGGVQKVTQNVAEELARRGNDVTVLVSNNKCEKKLSSLNGVKIIYWDLYTYKDRIIGDKKSYIEFIKKQSNLIDVLINVSVHSALTDVLLPHTHEIKCKTILYLHGIYDFSWSQKDKSTPIRIVSKLYYNIRRRLFYRKLYRYAKNYSMIIHLSENDMSLKYMKDHGIKQNVVIHNGAEKTFFDCPLLKNTDRYFLQVANYAEHKNQEFSLKAFYLSNIQDNIRLIYIGSEKNDYYKMLKDLKSKYDKIYGQREVELLTNISRQETIDYFKGAIAIVLSSRVEKFPMVLVEGNAASVPFISTDCGNVKELSGGIVVKSIEEMSEAFRIMANDLTVRRMYAKKGYEEASLKYSFDKNIEYLESMIEGL